MIPDDTYICTLSINPRPLGIYNVVLVWEECVGGKRKRLNTADADSIRGLIVDK